MERSRHYILSDDGLPVPCDLLTWAAWFEQHPNEKKVEQTQIGEALVSTVFLGLDHNYNPDSPYPLIYETMIFGGPHNDYQWRYATREQARLGHEQVCQFERGEIHKP